MFVEFSCINNLEFGILADFQTQHLQPLFPPLQNNDQSKGLPLPSNHVVCCTRQKIPALRAQAEPNQLYRSAMFNQLKAKLTCTGPPEAALFAVPCRHPHTGQPGLVLRFYGSTGPPPRHEGSRYYGHDCVVQLVLRLSRESDNREGRCVSSCAPRLLETRSVTYYRAVSE